MSQANDSSITTRRMFVTGAALAVAAVPVVAVAGGAADATDPIYSAIDRHRALQARVDEMAAGDTYDEDEFGDACGEARDAWKELGTTAPKTLAGLLALATYMDEFLTRYRWLECQADAGEEAYRILLHAVLGRGA